MPEPDEGVDGSGCASLSLVECGCACLNVRWTAKLQRQEQDNGVVDSIESWKISQIGLVRILNSQQWQPQSHRRSSQSPSESAHVPSSSSPSSSTLRRLHCYGCESDVLTFHQPAGNDGNDMAQVNGDRPPQSSDGTYFIDRTPSSTLLIGRRAINAIVENPTESSYSPLFGMVVRVSDKVRRQREASSSSNTEAIDGEEGEGDDGTSPVLRRQTKSSDLQRTLSDEASEVITLYQEEAKARIRQEKQELEAQISKLRFEREQRARAYLAEADMLSIKAASLFAVKPRGRRTSPSKPSSSSQPIRSKASPSGPVVIRGGFDSPSEAGSPSSTAVGISPRTNLALSPPVKPKSYKAFLSMISGEPLVEGPSSDTQKDVAQVSKPQSPSFRRSRSPSPTRDGTSSTPQQRAASKDRSVPKASTSKIADGVQSSGMDRAGSGSGSLSKRPPLNLESNVKAESSSPASRSRPSLTPQHSSLKNPSSATSRLKPSSGGTWLKLNGEASSSSPSSARVSGSLLQSMEDAVGQIEKAREEEKAAQRTAENDVSAIFDKSKQKTGDRQQEDRPNLSKARHVSFKEPELPISAPAPAPEPDEETVFELDEEVEASSDEEDTAEEKVAATATSASQTTSISTSKSRSLSPSLPLPPGASSYREQHASLIELLDNARSFVGSLKTVYQPKPPPDLAKSVQEAYSGYGAKRYLGNTRLTGKSIELPRHASLPASAVSPEVAASLREQSQKFRDMLAMDLPSHRGRGSRNKKTTAAMLRESEEMADEEITNEEMDRLAPLSNLATSLPIAIGYPLDAMRKRPDIEFEQKTSVPTGEGMIVPRYKRDRRSDGTYANTVGGLAILGEEAEPTPSSSPAAATAQVEGKGVALPGAQWPRTEIFKGRQASELSQGSPPNAPKLSSTTTAQDANIALVNREEADELELDDEVSEIRGKGGFVPPHLWSRKRLSSTDVLGTSVHDYE